MGGSAGLSLPSDLNHRARIPPDKTRCFPPNEVGIASAPSSVSLSGGRPRLGPPVGRPGSTPARSGPASGRPGRASLGLRTTCVAQIRAIITLTPPSRKGMMIPKGIVKAMAGARHDRATVGIASSEPVWEIAPNSILAQGGYIRRAQILL